MCTPDGFCLGHFRVRGGEALESAARLFALMGMLGSPPEAIQLQHVPVALNATAKEEGAWACILVASGLTEC
eukprot:5850521-Pyramimonas_sp.AAC.1